ncbi:MAG: hypothetical protein M3R60_06275, partial [Pseudomonadota bacterium]|nr:hypothetical protein [Pseudomonadota bacterium]
MFTNTNVIRWLVPLLLAMFARGHAHAAITDHHEFDTTLSAPYQGDATGAARTFILSFDYPLADSRQTVSWRLLLTAPDGRAVRQ